MTLLELEKRIQQMRNWGATDDTPIYMERVEDVYFEKHGWKTIDVIIDEPDYPSKFFQIHDVGFAEYGNMVLIHAHY